MRMAVDGGRGAPDQAVMLSLDAIARHLDIPPSAPPDAFPPDLPEPDGRLGSTPWWWSTTIAAWLRSSPSPGRDRRRPAPGPLPADDGAGRHASPDLS